MKKKTVLMTCLTMTLLSQTMVCKAAASPLLKVQTAQQDSKTFRKRLRVYTLHNSKKAVTAD